MKTPMHIIALRTIKHNERSSILTAFSLEAGRVAFALPAGGGREAIRRRALLMPLSAVECVADTRRGTDILLMHEPRPMSAAPSAIHGNPVKSSLALFSAEVLGAVLRESGPDEGLFAYIYNCMEVLAALPSERTANFHIMMLMGLGRFIGIDPRTDDFRPGMVFDMAEGRFRASPPLHRHYLPPADAEAVARLSRMTPANMHLYRMTRAERSRILDLILDYYSLHVASLKSLKSLDILRTLF